MWKLSSLSRAEVHSPNPPPSHTLVTNTLFLCSLNPGKKLVGPWLAVWLFVLGLKMLKSQIRSCYCLSPEPPLSPAMIQTHLERTVSFCIPRHWLGSGNLQGFILSEIPMPMWCASQSALAGGEIAPVSKGGDHTEISNHIPPLFSKNSQKARKCFEKSLALICFDVRHCRGPAIVFHIPMGHRFDSRYPVSMYAWMKRVLAWVSEL